MMPRDEPGRSGSEPAEVDAGLGRRYEELRVIHAAELRLAQTLGNGGGLRGLVAITAELVGMATWLLDPRGRVVARSANGPADRLPAPDIATLLAVRTSEGTSAHPSAAALVAAKPGAGLARRHLLASVVRADESFGWLVVAEIPGRFSRIHHVVVDRAAFHLGTEYGMQRKVARVAWNAKSTLARQMVRGSALEEDLRSSADYLGVEVDADRVLVFVLDAGEDGPGRDDARIAERLAHDLGVEVLGTRGIEGAILLIEAPAKEAPGAMVERVRAVMTRLLRDSGADSTVVGISAVTKAEALHRAYRETREVVRVADRFARAGSRVIAVDDLGPARLFVANGDVASVRRYVQEVLGPLLEDRPAIADLLITLQCFFDSGRSVRESAVRLGIHENTVRLRLSKVRDLIGLDVAADSHAQLSVQTALLVLRLEGHPAVTRSPGDSTG